jgi:DNA-binding protein H-NS
MAKNSYTKLRQQIETLEKSATQQRNNAITEVKTVIRDFGLTASDLFGASSSAVKASPAVGASPISSGRIGRPAGSKNKVSKATTKKAFRKGAGIPKYRDPKTGVTWTGFGKPPAWIAGKTNREAFLIDAPTAAAAPVATAGKPAAKAEAAAKPAVKKAAPKAAAKPAAKKVAAKPAAKKVVAKKPAAKPAVKKAAPKAAAKPAAKKAVAKKPVAKKAVAKKPAKSVGAKPSGRVPKTAVTPFLPPAGNGATADSAPSASAA